MQIELQTTSVQDPVDQSRIVANNDAAWMNMPTCIIFGGVSEVIATGVTYVDIFQGVLLQPPDDMPDFDIALWHDFAV